MPARNLDRRVLDLNASRAARREAARKKPIAVTLGKDTFELPGSLPMSAMIAFAELQQGDVTGFRTILESFFGERADEALKAGLELDDLYEIMDLYMSEEDDGSGKSPGSPTSSSSTSKRSKPTSKPSTV